MSCVGLSDKAQPAGGEMMIKCHLRSDNNPLHSTVGPPTSGLAVLSGLINDCGENNKPLGVFLLDKGGEAHCLLTGRTHHCKHTKKMLELSDCRLNQSRIEFLPSRVGFA